MNSYQRNTPAENPQAGGFPPPPSSLSENRSAVGAAPRVLFAVISLGLGHSTRKLAVIREYLACSYVLTVVSYGNALAFLRLELEGKAAVEFREMQSP